MGGAASATTEAALTEAALTEAALTEAALIGAGRVCDEESAIRGCPGGSENGAGAPLCSLWLAADPATDHSVVQCVQRRDWTCCSNA